MIDYIMYSLQTGVIRLSGKHIKRQLNDDHIAINWKGDLFMSTISNCTIFFNADLLYNIW